MKNNNGIHLSPPVFIVVGLIIAGCVMSGSLFDTYQTNSTKTKLAAQVNNIYQAHKDEFAEIAANKITKDKVYYISQAEQGLRLVSLVRKKPDTDGWEILLPHDYSSCNTNCTSTYSIDLDKIRKHANTATTEQLISYTWPYNQGGITAVKEFDDPNNNAAYVLLFQEKQTDF